MQPRLAWVLRSLAPALAGAADARSEVHALIWGPRFDRLHARSLAATLPPATVLAVDAAADRFDGLSARQQQRLRRLAAGAPACAPTSQATMAHAPHPAH